MDLSKLQEMLDELAACGIRLAPGRTAADIAAEWGEELDDLEYEDVLLALGSDSATPEETNSHDIWHFDTECIADDGDYVAIAERMKLFAGGALPIDDIRDRVAPDNTWLSFRLDGEEHWWPASWNDDWVDAEILEKFAQLLDARRTGRRFTYCDLGGQDCLIGCSTPREKTRLNKLTGLRFRWLSSSDHSSYRPTDDPRAAVSERVLVCKPDRAGKVIKFACGAVVGALIGFFGSVRFVGLDNLLGAAIGALIGACIAGYLAMDL